jgi:deazaflavin-dependent oxidoreductase (nitroreductase family)
VPDDLTAVERHTRDEAVMAELRANGGRTSAGQTLIILSIAGSKTGRLQDKPVCVSEEGPELVIAASAGGQVRHPQWYTSLMANPDITVEYLGDKFPVTAATVANSVERDRLFETMSREIPGLYGYQDRCRDSRQIPIIRLARR